MLAFIHANIAYDWAHFRHFIAWGFAVPDWFTNASEQIIATVFALIMLRLLWPLIAPRLRAIWDELHRSEREHRERLAANAERHLNEHVAALHARIDEVHDHIERTRPGGPST
jgi:hypothetical protein